MPLPAADPKDYADVPGIGRVHIRTQLDELDRVDCHDDLHFFLQKAWKFIDPAPFVDGWVLDALCEHLEAVVDGQIKRLLINIPPRMSKSSLISVAFPTWVWLQQERTPTSGPGVAMLHASYAYTLALRDSVKRRRLIKTAWYQRLFGQRKVETSQEAKEFGTPVGQMIDWVKIAADQDMKTRFQNTRGGESLITSVDAGVTGEGGGLILVDDPNNAREALSETTIMATNEEWWDGAMSTRLNDTNRGAIIVVQQRLGEQDLSGHILANDKRQEWDHLVLPMHYDSRRQASTSIGWTDPRQEENELLWPQRFDKEAVRDLETRLGSKWRAAGQLEQRPEPKGGGIIKREWWQLWPPGGEREGAGARPIEWPPFSFILGSLDTAYTEDELNDPSALTIWGIFEDADLVNIPTRKIQRDGSVISVYDEDYLQDLTRPKTVPKVMLIHAWAKRLELNPLVRQVEKDCKTFQVDRLLIEAKASGISVAQEIKRLYANANFSTLLNPLSRGRGASRNDKVSRLYSVQHLFEEQLVFAPERPWAEEVMDECGTFPNGTHDDRVDTCLSSTTLVRMGDGSTKAICEIVVGELVATPQGSRRVLWSGQTGIKQIWEMQSTNSILRGTANHPVWADGEWVPLAKLRPYAKLTSWHGLANQDSLSKTFASTDTPIDGILSRIIPRIADIFRDLASSCTVLSGRSIEGLSRQAGTFIMSMATAVTMILPISNVWRAKHTMLCIASHPSNEDGQFNNCGISTKYVLKLRLGTRAKKVVRGIASMPSNLCTVLTIGRLFQKLIPSICRAYGANPNLRHGISELDSVLHDARPQRAHGVEVRAVRCTQSIEPVFNLTIEDVEMFYANDILVHNCSQALRHLRAIGLLTRGAELQAETERAIRHVGRRRARVPLYPGTRA